MKEYKYILFDLDGTLTDPAVGITTSVAYALEKFGIKVNDISTLNHFIGPPLLDSFMSDYGFDKEKAAEKVSSLSSMLSLESVLNKKAGKLSGGYARRLSIAMALISEPKVLFLDEPTLGLDVIARSELWDIINSLKGKVTIILTTHYMEEAEALSDRIAIMKDGKLLICDTPDAIKAQTGEDSIEKAFIQIVKGVQK